MHFAFDPINFKLMLKLQFLKILFIYGECNKLDFTFFISLVELGNQEIIFSPRIGFEAHC